jgi:toxin FitB
MLVLDTNVISELMKISPSPRVTEWWGQQQSGELFTTTVTMAEILYGIEILPKGKRRDSLLAEADAVFTQDLAGRILPFDEEAARCFSEIAARRRAEGRPIAELDAQVAAVAHSRRAILATRNTTDFEGCSVRLTNPWGGQ